MRNRCSKNAWRDASAVYKTIDATYSQTESEHNFTFLIFFAKTNPVNFHFKLQTDESEPSWNRDSDFGSFEGNFRKYLTFFVTYTGNESGFC